MIFSGPQETVLQMRNTWRNYKYFPVKISRTLCMWMGTMKRDRQRAWNKNGLKILNKLIQNPTGRKPKQWDLFYAQLSLCSESHVDLKWAEMCQHVLLQNSTPRQAKNLETAHWRQMHSLPFASFANWWLFCKAAATLTRIPNACLHWRDHINVNDVWYTDVSHTDISHTNRCIIHRCITHKDVSYTESADKETRKTLIENKKHKKSQKHQRKRLVSVHNESLNSMLRGAFMPGSSQHLSHCEKDLAAFQITCEHFRGSHKTNSQRIFLFK